MSSTRESALRSQRGRAAITAIALLAVAAAAAGGYWAGQRGAHAPAAVADAAPAGKDANNEKGGRKILYYRNPMGLPDTSPTPKKDSMGMDYIPVYEGEDQDSGSGIRISTEKMQKLGVRTAAVERRTLDAVVRASGRIEVDERRLATIAPKFEGWIEKLYVNATGQQVTRGAPLFDAYSPELLAAQREYAVAARGVAALKDADPQAVAGMQRLADSALARLRSWDVGDDEVARLAAGGEPRRTLSFRAPAGGIVLERRAVQGMRFMPGDALFQIADLSSLWLVADVSEQDLGRVRIGNAARVRIEAYAGQVRDGRVSYIYPTLQADTRTAQVRIELANADGRLKPAMFAQVEISSSAAAKVLAVPNSAVIDSGTRRVVIVDRGDGRFEPRAVTLAGRGDEFTAVTDGVQEGERVVVAANFLIDAESNLRAALGSMTAPGADAASPTAGAQGSAGAKGAGGKVVHSASGTLDDADPKTGGLLISHGPVPSLSWPAMTMEFKAANDAVAKAARPGEPIRFEFVERGKGEWVVTKMERGSAAAAPAKSARPAAAGGANSAGAGGAHKH
jgi:RND family efflux transporter MFP subunit